MTQPYWSSPFATLYQADARALPLPDKSVHTCFTSPPYFQLRSYGVDGQIGLEQTPAAFIAELVGAFREVKRVLRDDGTLMGNCGDSYSGYKGENYGRTQGNLPSHNLSVLDTGEPIVGGTPATSVGAGNLLGIPWRLAFALQDDGWIWRETVYWVKRAPMPESVAGWHFTRHRIKIEEYERMLNMPANSRRKSISASKSAMPFLSKREGPPVSADGSIPSGQEEISTKREGPSDCQGQGRTGGCAGETPSGQLYPTGPCEQAEIRGVRQGEGGTPTGNQEISADPKGKAEGTGRRPQEKPNGREASQEENLRSQVQEKREGEDGQCQARCQEARSHGDDSQRATPNCRTMANHAEGESLPLLLLPSQSQIDDRPRYSVEQGRATHDGERGAGLPVVQLQEARQHRNALVDCPGCAKCAAHDGLVLRRGSWRHTDAVEPVMLFVKQMGYYFDQEAMREPQSETTIERFQGGAVRQRGQKHDAADHAEVRSYPTTSAILLNGRNPRNVLPLGPAPFQGAHYATFPPALPRHFLRGALSEKGCCPRCGSQWARIVAPSDAYRKVMEQGRTVGDWYARPTVDGYAKPNHGIRAEYNTLGWKPTCSCPEAANPVPCTVLDNFAGTATTLQVAWELGHKGVGVDLSSRYLDMAVQRLSKLTLPLGVG